MAAIWFNKHLSLSDIQPLGRGTMGDHLGMEWLAVGDDYMKIKMPVDKRTIKPYVLLHGGASCALAETVGSVASHFIIDPDKFICVGLEINANHVRGVKEGYVIATCIPLHIGTSTHIWDIKIHDEIGKLVCISRLTVAIIPRKESFRQTSL